MSHEELNRFISELKNNAKLKDLFGEEIYASLEELCDLASDHGCRITPEELSAHLAEFCMSNATAVPFDANSVITDILHDSSGEDADSSIYKTVALSSMDFDSLDIDLNDVPENMRDFFEKMKSKNRSE
ncbi:MAG: Nif11 family protein [Planctomycetales bacterium]